MRFIAVLAAAAVIAGPVAAAPQMTPVIVYFEAKSDALVPSAQELLDATVAQYRQHGPGMVILAGHADPHEGSSTQGVGLSQRRANAVRDYLASQGVPGGVMTTQAFGQSRPAVQVDEPEPANRRVEITFGPGSGW
ncbi:OmpA family protein [Brevundimonas viscosa]|uniref:OmpA family protein n=1 Tax=Brevundimonas viscosa TaxID=871741 RepID=A0A1I6RZ71_9CAUL|nr:OmpA family protein [Brevundimonas viscosa]SFS69991.1 OmpA family protein [Brevundimonas viscosa]